MPFKISNAFVKFRGSVVCDRLILCTINAKAVSVLSVAKIYAHLLFPCSSSIYDLSELQYPYLELDCQIIVYLRYPRWQQWTIPFSIGIYHIEHWHLLSIFVPSNGTLPISSYYSESISINTYIAFIITNSTFCAD